MTCVIVSKCIFTFLLCIFLTSQNVLAEENDTEIKAKTVMEPEEYYETWSSHRLVHNDQIPNTQEEPDEKDEYENFQIECPSEDIDMPTSLAAAAFESADPNAVIIRTLESPKISKNVECSDAEDGATMMSECRSCYIQLKPDLASGVILTCFECNRQHADMTCKLGMHRSKDNIKYRVSATLFEVVMPEETSESPTTTTEELQ